MGVEVPVGEIQVALRWKSTNDPDEMISTIGISGTNGTDDLQATAVNLAALTQTNLSAANMMHINWTFVGVTLYRAQDGGGAEVAESVVNTAGSLTLGSVPSNCALLVRKRTALAGRRNTGRMYLPPFSLDETAVNNNGVIGTTDLNGLQTRVDNWRTAVESYLGTEDLVLFHSLGGASGTEVLPSTPITSLTVDGQIATQRRRMR